MIDKATNIPIQFGGGLNTLSGPLSIEDNQSSNCKNVHSNITKTLQRLKGYSLLGVTSGNTNGYGLFEYRKDSNTYYLMAYIDTQLYKMDAPSGVLDGNLDSISFGTAMTGDDMEFEQVDEGGVNYLIMGTHSRDKLQKYDGTTCSDLSADTDTPRPKYIKSWMGYLFCANVAGYESRIYYNDIADAITGDTDWSALDYQNIRTNDGDYITAQAVLKGRLYTFKRYSIHRWTYYGGTPLFGIKSSVTGIGTISSKSVVNITHPKYGEVLVFLAADKKFYIFDGSQVLPISTNIENDNGISEFNLSKLNFDYMYRACAVNDTTMHWYVCWVPTTSYNNWGVIWDYYTDTWWPFDGQNANCVTSILSGGNRNIYWLGSTGTIYRFNHGNNNNGAVITSVYDTKKFSSGNLPLLKSYKYIELQLKNIPSASINIYHKSDWDSTWGTADSLSLDGGGFILGTSLLGVGVLGGSFAISRVLDLPIINHSIQFRFGASDLYPSWHICGANMIVDGIGYGSTS